MTTVAKLPITNVNRNGDYTALMTLGASKNTVCLELDTGSSALAVLGHLYDPNNDEDAQTTQLFQAMQYGDNSYWIGSVVETTICADKLCLAGVNLAVTSVQSDGLFGKADGILGLAYVGLNEAYDMGKSSWPAPSSDAFMNIAQTATSSGTKEHITPYFTQLVDSGMVENRFSMLTYRSRIHYGTATPDTDPLNNGYLVLGGGVEQKKLYSGGFDDIKILHDLDYNVHLKSVRLDGSSAIPAPNVTVDDITHNIVSNAIIDSGTNAIMLTKTVFDSLIAQFGTKNVMFLDAIHKAQHSEMKSDDLDLSGWPDLTFTFDGLGKADAIVIVKPECYWQKNGTISGKAVFSIYPMDADLTIFGLPILNNHYVIFDRSEGLKGAVRFAKAVPPS